MKDEAALRLVHRVASSLGDLVDDVVFLGGAVRGLLLTDPGVERPRATDDVDLIVEVTSTVDYHRFSEKLRDRSFSEDSSEDAPICRFRVAGIKVDVMPTGALVLGFSNDWYPHAMATASRHLLDIPGLPAISIRVISAPSFVATKLVAFAGRANGDMAHHDLEDIVAVVNGRAELLSEVEHEQIGIRMAIGEGIQTLFTNDLENKINWHITPDAMTRVPLVLTRLHRLARVPRLAHIGDAVPLLQRTCEILAVEFGLSIPRYRVRGTSLAIHARITNHDHDFVALDDSQFLVEDGFGNRHPPHLVATRNLRQDRNHLQQHDPLARGVPHDTLWVYQLKPADVFDLRFIFPSDEAYELRLQLKP